jgi:hypothetical protein
MGKRKKEPVDETLQKFGPGYSPEMDVHYDAKYISGKVTGFVVAPKITEEEAERRWKQFCEVLQKNIERMVERKNSTS